MNYYQYQTVLGLLTICEENDNPSWKRSFPKARHCL